jgi:hypothetical protein
MSTRQLTDASQEITDGYTYDAFGILPYEADKIS